MRGRVAAVLILILLAAPTFPQCSLAPVASAQFRSTIFDLSVDGNRLWAATSYGLTVYDITADPPLILDSIALPGPTRVVRASNGTAYAASGSAIQYVRWTGRELQLAGAIDVGAVVNDLVVTTNYLYAATAAGIAQYDLLNPAAPAKTSVSFATSGTNVGSLALTGNTLYATDGDSSVEVFNIGIPNLPQHVGAYTTVLPRPTAVRAVDGRVYVSDGVQTDLLLGNDADLGRAGTFPFGSSSFARLSSNALFTAGNDRRIRAFDVSSAGSPVEIYRTELGPTAGTVNRINAVAIAAGRLYAGGGDIGLLTYDISQFVAPYPLRSYSTTPTGSVSAKDGRVYFGRAAGLVEYSQTSSGALTESRSWDKSRVDVVHDLANDFLLTSSGAAATVWALSPTTPTQVGSATFRAPVRQAVLIGLTAYAVLEDETLWSADLSQASATPQQVSTTLAPDFIARSGANYAVAALGKDGTTSIVVVTNGTPSAPAKISGLATAGIALSGSTVAAWTFRGLTLIDFPSGTTTLLPQSAGVAATRLALNGTKLAEMTDSGVSIWDTAAQRWTTVHGPYQVLVGNSARDLRPAGTVRL